MRIISGAFKGRKLTTPQGWDIRPTSDRVREAVFNIIAPRVKGAAVLDLFAGTGAFGLEALSRGADHAVFIDGSPKAVDLINRNIDLCRIKERTTVFCLDLSKSLLPQTFDPGLFDLIFMDPPYGKELLKNCLTSSDLIRFLTEDSLVIAEHGYREKLPVTISGLDIHDQRKYGKTLITFLKLDRGC